MRALILSAALLTGCSLVTPFELGPSSDAEPADADGDADADVDVDESPDGDADSDGDAPTYDYLAGCVGGDTEERWAVATLDGPYAAVYITERAARIRSGSATGAFLRPSPRAVTP